LISYLAAVGRFGWCIGKRVSPATAMPSDLRAGEPVLQV